MAAFNYKEYQEEANRKTNTNTNQNRSQIGFFNLKKNGEEAIVRFAYNSPEEFSLHTVHTINIGGKLRKIDCLNDPHNPESKCPLCEADNKPTRRFFIKLIQYVRDENGQLQALPKIWERSDRYANTLSNLFKEYGNDCVFKIRRNGENGDVKTSYDILYASPAIYKPEIYVAQPDAFKDFNILKSWFILSRTAKEMEAILNPQQPARTVQSVVQTTSVPETPVQTNPTTITPTVQNTYSYNTTRPTYYSQQNETIEQPAQPKRFTY